ncbi:hypothetical protein [Kitasatospora griseola]|uniref:Uncharacterized protein n=1 Tax=Kitasatospora griseola TaxID=2064 RepID=A0A0D0NW83_KITGR|nr:hypothetical protein [Kitasatospora griseola]KIQ63491.1 hypothetical protein TR51_33170 [Kitasatospora griseola]
MADDTITTAPVAEPATEHTAAPVDPTAIERALEELAKEPAPTIAPKPLVDPKIDETFEPLGNVGNCP